MKSIKYLFFIFILSLSLVGCKNNSVDENIKNNNSVNKTDKNNKSDTEIKDIFKFLSNTYWIEENPDYGQTIIKIDNSIIKDYSTYSEDYSTYKINKKNYDSDKNTLTINTTAYYYDTTTNLDLHIELLSEKNIRLKIDKDDGYTLNLKSISTDKLVKLIYNEGLTTFDNSYIQDILGKTENELYQSIGLFYPSNLNSDEIKYIESRHTKSEVLEKVTSLKIFNEMSSTYPIIYDEEVEAVKVGSKLGYLITVRSYGEVTDSRINDIFLDIDSGNIYSYDYFDTMQVNLNNVISKIEI